jgi:hypothetical protein
MATEVINAEIKSNIESINKDIAELKQGMEKSSKETKKLSASFGTLAKASGIVFILTKAFEVLKDVFSKNQKVVDAFDTGMTALTIVFNDLFSFIENNVGTITGFFKDLFENPKEKITELRDVIKEGLIDRFNEFVEVLGLAGKAFGQLVKGEFSAAFDTIKEAGKEVVDVYTGVDGSFEKVAETVTNYTKSVIDNAKAITATNKAAQLAAVEFARLNAQYLKDAEIQRQIRDDETKTFEERIKANEKLDKILGEQQDLQRAQVQTQIDAAQAQFKLNGSIENRIALGEAQNAMLELEETITGQLSEQKTNAVALDKELLEVTNELTLAKLDGMSLELEELRLSYEQKLLMAEKAGIDDAAITEKYQKEKSAIEKRYAQETVKWSEMSTDQQLDIASQTAGNLATIMGEQTAAGKAMAITQATIDTYKGANAAYASMASIPYVGPVLGGIAAAAAIASGIKNVQAIASSGEGGGGGGGISASGQGGGPQPPAPQMMSGAFELGGGIEPEPIKAFVVTDEMSNSQDQLANIRRRATI